MKKFAFIIAAMLGIASTSYAQGPYVQLGTGFLLGVNENMGSKINDTPTSYKERVISGSFGKGLPFGINVGYFINKNIAFELGIGYRLGLKQNLAEINSNRSDTLFGTILTSTSTTNITGKSSGLSLSPRVMITSDINEKMGLYTKIGLVFPTLGKLVTNNEETESMSTVGASASTNTTVIVNEIKGRMAVGYMGSLGVYYKLSDRLDVWGELTGQNLRIKGKSSEYSTYTINGADVLTLASTDAYDTKVEFENELTNNSNNEIFNPNFKPSEAKNEVSTKSNFSNIGIGLGVSFHF